MTKYCEKCKVTEVSLYNYCRTCGEKLTEVSDCECGQQIFHSDKFCPKCGLKKI